MINFTKDFLSIADIDSGNTRVGMVVYSTSVSIEFHLNQYTTKSDVFRAIDKIQYAFGNTYTAGGIRTMRTEMFTSIHGDRPTVPNIAVVITDGQANVQATRTIPEAEAAKDDGIEMYAIGISLLETEELKGIASRPLDDHLYTVEDFEELSGLMAKIFQAVCFGK